MTCRNVIRDVTRVLYLLNKKPSNVKMPVDGPQLMRWADSILKRYLAAQVCAHMYTHMYTHMNTHMYTHMYTHTCTWKGSWGLMSLHSS